MRRARRRKQAQENVIVTHKDTNVERETVTMIILPTQARLTPEGYIVQDFRYKCNVIPPNFNIKIGDEITRTERSDEVDRGSTDEHQVLVVQDVNVLWGTQQLQTQDRRFIR